MPEASMTINHSHSNINYTYGYDRKVSFSN